MPTEARIVKRTPHPPPPSILLAVHDKFKEVIYARIILILPLTELSKIERICKYANINK
jgi:hypothetical protein